MQRFDSLSNDYENILNSDIKRLSGEGAQYFADYKAECVRSFLGEGFSGSILEYGCGVGLLSKSLRRQFDEEKVSITGYDISRESLNKARQSCRGIAFIDDSSRLGNGRYDAIVLANVLHHVPLSCRQEFLAKTALHLSKNGHLFIFEHNPCNPLTRAVVKRSVLDKGVILARFKDTAKLMEKCGFCLQQRKYIVFFPGILGWLRLLEPALGWMPLGAQYLLIGRRRGH